MSDVKVGDDYYNMRVVDKKGHLILLDMKCVGFSDRKEYSIFITKCLKTKKTNTWLHSGMGKAGLRAWRMYQDTLNPMSTNIKKVNRNKGIKKRSIGHMR